MEIFPEMTLTVLDRAPVTGDAGRVTGERRERPDPEVPEKARRRTFTAQYKLDVVAEYDAAPTGEKGAVLRREGLYSSHVIEWRRARDTGVLAGPARPRGRPAADPRDAQITRLTKEKAKLRPGWLRLCRGGRRRRCADPGPSAGAVCCTRGRTPGNAPGKPRSS